MPLKNRLSWTHQVGFQKSVKFVNDGISNNFMLWMIATLQFWTVEESSVRWDSLFSHKTKLITDILCYDGQEENEEKWRMKPNGLLITN